MDNGGDLFVGVAGGAGGSARGSSSSCGERGYRSRPGRRRLAVRPPGREGSAGEGSECCPASERATSAANFHDLAPGNAPLGKKYPSGIM